LVGRTNARATQDRYYLYRNRASEDKNRVRALYKSLQKDPDNPDLVAQWKRISAQFNVEIGYGGDLDWTASTLKIFDATDDRLKELREQLTDVQADDGLGRADRVAREREITLQIEDLQRAAIKTHLDMAAIAASKSGPVDEVAGAR
ncbi:MAG: hypothetical protein LCH61_17260, partial [Proteobacteria bacterium]|nr:hypothetical protein [Pseudomonadota bacterium]